QTGEIRPIALCGKQVARDDHRGQQREQVNECGLFHRGDSSSEPSRRWRPNRASPETTTSNTIAPDTSGVTNAPAAALPMVCTIVQASVPELIDAASQMQPFSVIVSARTKAQAAIGSKRYPPATIAVIATTAIPARRALRMNPPSRSAHQLISHVLLRA